MPEIELQPVEVPNKVVEITTQFLSGLENAPEVGEWAREHPEEVAKIVGGYNQLIIGFNRLGSRTKLMKAMSLTSRLKEVLTRPASDTEEEDALEVVRIPDIQTMSDGNFGKALIEARPRMLAGQAIAQGENPDPTAADTAYAIGTTSMDTTAEALAVGTIGHIVERVFFNWARENGFEPEGGWQKDMFLQAMDEVVLLYMGSGEAEGLTLTEYFTKTTEGGGLGWIRPERVEEFEAAMVQALFV